MRREKVIVVFVVFFLVAFVSAVVWAICVATRSCPGYCDSNNQRYYDAPDQSCTYSEGCCVMGEYGCIRYACSCGTACTPPPCPYVRAGTDNDGDGYDSQCGDCDDNNPNVNEGVSNPYCDCDASDAPPGGVPSTSGVPEYTNCECAATDPANPSNCIKFKAGCLCLDGFDNDCDSGQPNGGVDTKDIDCPIFNKDWVVAVNFTLDVDKDIGSGGLYILSGFTLTIDGVTLKVSKSRGVHLLPNAHIRLINNGHIALVN